jgi:hypothetical protein
MDHSRFDQETVRRLRHQVEGVLLAAGRRYSDRVASLSGKEIAYECGGKKSEIETEAGELFGVDAKEPGAAALAALKLAGEA